MHNNNSLNTASSNKLQNMSHVFLSIRYLENVISLLLLERIYLRKACTSFNIFLIEIGKLRHYNKKRATHCHTYMYELTNAFTGTKITSFTIKDVCFAKQLFVIN